MKVKVKICGIRSLEKAQVAIDSGADFIGFNFVPSSRRYIHPQTCRSFIGHIKGKIKTVGVFQNENPDTVNIIGDSLGLDFVQLHGNDDESAIKKIKYPIIKSVSIFNVNKNLSFEFLLLDRVEQGKGDMVDFKQALKIAKHYKIFFAGGLTPENVSYIVSKVKPFCVDVAGGIETKNTEDSEKIKQFVANAKGVEI